MREIDVVLANIDLIKHALLHANIPVADYRKYVSSGEYVYPDDKKDKQERISKDKKSAQVKPPSL